MDKSERYDSDWRMIENLFRSYYSMLRSYAFPRNWSRKSLKWLDQRNKDKPFMLVGVIRHPTVAGAPPFRIWAAPNSMRTPLTRPPIWKTILQTARNS